MADKEVKETEPFGQKIATEPEPEVETPTPDVQLSQLHEQINQLTKERDEFKKGLSTAHSQLGKKEQESRRLADFRAELDELKELQKVGFALMADQGRIPEGGIEPEQARDLTKAFDTKVSELERKRQMREAQDKIEAIRERTETLGLTEDDSAYWDVHDAATEYKFPKAEAILRRLEKAREPEVKETDTKKESDEERINKLVEERLRQAMEEKGLLGSDAGTPAGATTSDDKIRENYRKNPNNKAAYQAMKELQTRIRNS